MDDISNGKGEYYTGERNKKLLVHVVQSGVEVSKPIKTNIYSQSVQWRKRVYPVIPEKFIVDSDGKHHMFVEANDSAVLSFNKDHEDKCRKCGGKMTIDARNNRELNKRGVIQAIWGIDPAHMVLLIVMGVIVILGIGAALYFGQENSTLHTKIDTAKATKNLNALNFVLGEILIGTGS